MHAVKKKKIVCNSIFLSHIPNKSPNDGPFDGLSLGGL